MANTPSFNWETPDDTDLVKDGAAAIRTLGNAIDSSMTDLKGGTTGQVLSKASNTDMDFTWSSVDPLTILDAKGDLISATAADSPARLAVGADGTYLQADSTTSTGLKWGTVSAGGMTELASGSIAASATGVDLSSISNAYKDLMLVCRGISANTDAIDFYIRLNNDSGANYYGRYINGSTISAFSGGTSAAVIADSTGSYTSGCLIFNLYDYANTSSAKAFSSLGLAKLTTHTSTWGFWNSTSAVNRITFFNNGSFDAGTYILYGVK